MSVKTKPANERDKSGKGLVTAARGPGRPSDYEEGIAMDICDRIADGELLLQICREPGYPSRATLYRWRRRYPDFDRDYNLAVMLWVEALSEECIEIVDNLSSSESLKLVKLRLAERHAMIARRTQDRTSVGRSSKPKKY
jgi:hypothetical protein